jgi:hypothetical protein
MRLVQISLVAMEKPLLATDHPTIAGSFSNTLATQADLNETSLETIID